MGASSLSPIANLSGNLTPQASLSGTLSSAGGEIVQAPEYPENDVYNVIPKAFESQRFRTAGKMLTGDVIVAEVPYYVTSNTAGGNTVYIAKEGAVR